MSDVLHPYCMRLAELVLELEREPGTSARAMARRHGLHGASLSNMRQVRRLSPETFELARTGAISFYEARKRLSTVRPPARRLRPDGVTAPAVPHHEAIIVGLAEGRQAKDLAAALGCSEAHVARVQARYRNATRAVGAIATTLAAVVNGLDEVDVGALDVALARELGDRLASAHWSLRHFIKRLKERGKGNVNER